MKKQVWFYALILLSVGILFSTLQAVGIESQGDNVVKLRYVPISNDSNGETFTLKTKLRVKNTISEPIYNRLITQQV